MDANRSKLYKAGVIYPKTAGKKAHRQLPLTAYHSGRRDDFTKRLGLHSETEFLEHQANTIRRLRKEIAGLQQKSPDKELRLVFSSEHIQSRLTEDSELARLREIIHDMGASSVEVVVYLRDPAELANSLYSTMIKNGSTAEQPMPADAPYCKNLCDHKNTIERYRAVFGENSVIPRLFLKSEFRHGSVVDDFLGAIGIKANEGFDPPENLNESLSVTGVNLLRRINHQLPTYIDNKPNPLRAIIVSHCKRHFSESKYVMPAKLYEEYDQAFAQSNEWVRQEFFPDRQHLFPIKAQPCESKLPMSSEDLDKMADFWLRYWTGANTRF